MVITKQEPYTKDEILALKNFMNNKRALEALASDLKRVAMGLQRGSIIMAKRFGEEALKRKSEITTETLDPYIVNILARTDETLRQLNDDRAAEDALMESVLLQNFVQKRLTGFTK